MTRRHLTRPVAGFKSLDDGTPGTEGTFEAIVAVFDNIDLAGDRIKAGAFTRTLDEWRASGDPIPVIFSHRWDDLDAHIGVADPTEVRELLPGDATLPAELAGLGGLYVKGRLDIDEDFAGRVWKRLERRSLREFSFAYDVRSSRPIKADNGDTIEELLDLDLFEVGPTLKGMNPATALLGAKARDLTAGMAPGDALDFLDALVITPPPAKTRAPGAAKRLPVTPSGDGDIEDTLANIRGAAESWAANEYGARNIYQVHLERTHLDTAKAIVTAERWTDPWGSGPIWELSYALDDAGATITAATPVALDITFRRVESSADAKARDGAYSRSNVQTTLKAKAQPAEESEGAPVSLTDLAELQIALAAAD